VGHNIRLIIYWVFQENR